MPQRRAYVRADNKLALNAGRDHELQAIEQQGLMALDLDIEVTGFSPAEIDPMPDEVLQERAAQGRSRGRGPLPRRWFRLRHRWAPIADVSSSGKCP
jgi:hypothetical protein